MVSGRLHVHMQLGLPLDYTTYLPLQFHLLFHVLTFVHLVFHVVSFTFHLLIYVTLFCFILFHPASDLMSLVVTQLFSNVATVRLSFFLIAVFTIFSVMLTISFSSKFSVCFVLGCPGC